MAVLHERIETALPVEDAFDFVADFANSSRWDPGVASSERLDPGPLQEGARYRLGVRVAGRVNQMEYRVTTLEPPHRVVLTGRGSGVVAVDDIRFEESPAGTLIDYRADIRLQGLLRLLEPFLGRAFDSIGRNAAAGMRLALAELEGQRSAQPSTD
jgi:dehydrogenase/reductase SDR family member 12